MRATIFICLALLLTTSVGHTTIYKWVDADGKITYSQSPPSDSNLSHEEVIIKSKHEEAEEFAIDSPQTDGATKPDDDFSSQKEKQEAEEKADLAEKQNDTHCLQSKQAIEVLSLARNRRFRDAQGNYKRLDEDEKAKLREGHQQFVDENCGE